VATSTFPDKTMTYDVERLKRDAPGLATRFRDASPFPHLVLDGYLDVDPQALASWPDPDWDGWATLDHAYSPHKRQLEDIALIPEPMAGLVRQLCEPRFLRVLEQITGIPKLLPDPYLTGGGLHMSGPGGVLNPHTDFHHHRSLNLYRRINVLVYLNEDWSLDDGGCLSLFDKASGQPVETVVPAMGRTVIFRTDDQSVHGFPTPVAEGKWRRSIALYYYTSDEAAVFSGDATTYWMETDAQRGVIRKARFALYRALLNASRAISVLAHVVNPNQGLGLVRSILRNRRSARDR
jgi:hypothetical protein